MCPEGKEEDFFCVQTAYVSFNNELSISSSFFLFEFVKASFDSRIKRSLDEDYRI